MRSKLPSSFRALSVLAIALASVMLVSGISPGATKFLTKQKAKKLFYTKAKADDRFVNVGEIEALTVEGWHEVGAPGQPGFTAAPSPGGPIPIWENIGSVHNTVAFYKDPLGVVHLKGVAKCGPSFNCVVTSTPAATIFTLPPEYQPAAQEAFPALTSVGGLAGPARVDVTSTGAVVLRDPLIPTGGWVTLDGITFRAA